jgi:Ser/Thr protein kinase RdoA (MazF antagonist)
MTEPGLTVPAPFAAVPRHRALIMEWIDSPRVDRLLTAARTRAERNRILANAGRWLRHFHDHGDNVQRPLGSIDLLRPLDTLLSGVGGVGARERAFRAAYGVLQASTRQFADTKVSFVTSHGDFSPANLFQGDGRTIGFDFKASTALPAARDVLHFLVYAKSFNTSTWMLLTSDVDRADLDAFLGAYGPLDPAMDERLLTLFRLAEALYSWAHLIDRMRREGTNARRLGRVLRLRAMARHAARKLRP